MVEESFDLTTKIILIGDVSVGKSSIVLKYINNSNNLNNYHNPTIGVDFYSKILNISDKRLKLHIWDTAGQEKYRSLAKSFYQNAKGVIAIYDITRKESFNNLDYWLKDVKSVLGNDIIILIVGNKLDLESKRQVNNNMISKLTSLHNATYFETSAKTSENINEIFDSISLEIYNTLMYQVKDLSLLENMDSKIILSNSSTNTSSKCC